MVTHTVTTGPQRLKSAAQDKSFDF